MTEHLQNPSEKSQTGEGGKRGRPTTAMRKLRRKLSRTPLRLPIIWYRHHGFRPEDVFIACYPRSGITWSRHTLFEILTGEKSGFRVVDATLRGLDKHHLGKPVLPGGGRLISTHEQYRDWKHYHKAIYLVRDARDVVLSEFVYLTNLEFFYGDQDEFVKHFLTTAVSGFGPWQRNVSSWLDSSLAVTPNFLLVRFEDLKQDPVAGFTRMANFLEVNPSPDLIQRAVANSSIEKMREKEQREPVKASVKGRFVGDGLVQGWRSKLSVAQVRLIEQYAGPTLVRLGYSLSDELPTTEGQANLE
jgi:Sulfotransferase domain